jgi:hypothetical protein
MALPLLDTAYLEKLRAYMESGDLAFDFDNASEEDKGAILDFLETLMDLSDLADATATRVIFKKDYLDAALGVNSEK